MAARCSTSGPAAGSAGVTPAGGNWLRSSRARSPSLQMPFTKTKSKALFLGRELSRHQQSIDKSRRFDTMQLESFSIHHAHWIGSCQER